VTELTWLLDPATGALVVEGLTVEEASALAGDLLPAAREIHCARPLAVSPLPAATDTGGLKLRVARLYHGSVVDGPGRRSVVQLQGCPIRCPGFIYSSPWPWGPPPADENVEQPRYAHRRWREG
jgi:hypothetical protein